MAGWDGKGSTRRWREIRLRVLRRDRYRCQLRLPGCTGRAEHVHHVNGKAAGDRLDNLVASCAPCNLKTGDPTKQQRRGQAAVDPPAQPRTLWAVRPRHDVHGGRVDRAYAGVSKYPPRPAQKKIAGRPRLAL